MHFTKSMIQSKKGIIVIFMGVLLLCGFQYYLHNNDIVTNKNTGKIIEVADQYIELMDKPDKIISHSSVCEKKDLGLMCILVVYQINNEKNVDCVYFERGKILKNAYHLSGAVGSDVGELIADSQIINDKNIVFVRGCQIEDIQSFKINKLNYTGKVKDGIYLDMIESKSNDMVYEIKSLKQSN